MALLWCDGFDHYGGDTSNMLDGVWAEVNGPLELADDSPRTGGYALRKAGASLGAVQIARRIFGGSFTTIGFGHAFRMASLPAQNNWTVILAQFRDIDNSNQVTVSVTTTGAIRVTSGSATGTVLADSDDGAVSAEQYQHFECRLTIDDTDGAIEVRINGVTVIDESGLNTDPTGAGDVRQVAVGAQNAAGAPVTDFDDMFAWDTSGDYNNDFLGDHRVLTLLPDQDTAQADWTSTEDTGYEAIAELAPDDDTSYIEGEADDVSEFELEALPDSVSAVSAVVMVGRMRKTDAGACSVQMGLVSAAVGSPATPAVADGADRPITEIYTYWQDVIEEDPATGAPWTRNGLASALLRFDRTA